MAQPPTRTPAEERLQVLLFAAANNRADIVAAALDQEKADATGNVAALLAGEVEAAKGTALHVACKEGHVDVVRVLLLRGAPPCARLQGTGQTPLQVALSEAPKSRLSLIQGAFEAELFKRAASGDKEGVEVLVLGGLDLKQCRQGEYTPVAWAELFEQFETARLLQALLDGTALKSEPEETTPPDDVEVSNGIPVKARLSLPTPALHIWPPVSAWMLSATKRVSIPVPLVVDLPPSLDRSVTNEILEILRAGVRAALGTSCTSVEPLLPRLRGTRSGQAHFALALSRGLSQNPGHFRLCAKAASASEPGRIELVAHDVAALRAGATVTGQLLTNHGRRIEQAEAVDLPAVVLEAAKTSTGSGASVLLQLFDLPDKERRTLLSQLLKWQVARLFTLISLKGFQQQQRSLMQAIFEVRGACRDAGVDLVPVIFAEDFLSLRGGEGPAGALHEDLLDLLAQFHGSFQLGLRVRASAWPKRSAPDFVTCVERLKEQLLEAKSLATLAGLGHASGAIPAVAIWMPAEVASDAELLSHISAQMGGVTGCGLSLVVETPVLEQTPQSLAALSTALVTAAELGLPAMACASGSTQSLELPSHVWPRFTASNRARKMADLMLEVSQAGGSGTVVEVPLHGAPWCGCGLSDGWCALTTLLAAGLARNPELGLASLGLAPESTDAWLHQLSALLASQLLWQGNATSMEELAAVMWETETRDLDDLVTLLLLLLGGQLPQLPSKGLETTVGRANVLFQSLTDRREKIRRLGSSVPKRASELCALAVVGLEWLRYSCRLLLLLLKHSPQLPQGAQDSKSKPSALHSLRLAIKALPPTKVSDTRNGFLACIERTVSGSPGLAPGNHSSAEEEEGASATLLGEKWNDTSASASTTAIYEVMWTAGLRLGAALELQPWASFSAKEEV